MTKERRQGVTTTRGSESRVQMGVLFLVMLLCQGCGLADKLKDILHLGENVAAETNNTLNHAIDQLGLASADWQSILRETSDKLVKDAQSTVRAEITTLISRSVGMAGAEFRCDADFTRERVREALIAIRDEFMGRQTPPPAPAFCGVAPAAIDMSLPPERRNVIEFFGYNFDKGRVQAVVRGSNDRDVTDKLAMPTHYHLTLNLGGNGAQLDQSSQMIVLRWAETDQHTISVIQPATPVCQSEIVNVDDKVATFVPPHTRGDADYSGHGPHVMVTVALSASPDKLRALIDMAAIEWENGQPRSDFTTADGSTWVDLYSVDPGKRIVQILTDGRDDFSYDDGTTGVDDHFQRGGGLVQLYDFVGDTSGPEAGTRTSVTVHFNRIRLQVREAGNCVLPSSLVLAKAAGALSPGTEVRLRTSVLATAVAPELLNRVRLNKPTVFLKPN